MGGPDLLPSDWNHRGVKARLALRLMGRTDRLGPAFWEPRGWKIVDEAPAEREHEQAATLPRPRALRDWLGLP